jgi:hypothetical protein
VHRRTGARYEVITAFIDWAQHDRDDGVKAFTIRDDMIVPLAEEGSERKVTTATIGTVHGRKATADDPMPVGNGPVIH